MFKNLSFVALGRACEGRMPLNIPATCFSWRLFWDRAAFLAIGLRRGLSMRISERTATAPEYVASYPLTSAHSFGEIHTGERWRKTSSKNPVVKLRNYWQTKPGSSESPRITKCHLEGADTFWTLGQCEKCRQATAGTARQHGPRPHWIFDRPKKILRM